MRRENLRCISIDLQPQLETIVSEHLPSQRNPAIGQSLENESNYAGLEDRASKVHQQEIYNQLHIYGNANAQSEFYVNERDIHLEQRSPEYEYVNSIDLCPINLSPEYALYSTVSQL